jgi:hypothetical protein
MSATQQAFSVAKSTVELYKIRHTSGCYWADITIDAHGRGGRISIASDYGNWQNYWGAAGPNFKSFLGQINEGYAADKFDVKERVDVAASVKSWREDVLKCRRQEDITDDEARELWDEIEGLALYSHSELERELLTSSYLIDFLRQHSDSEWLSQEPDPRFGRFWKEIWPVLLAEFARESAPQEVVSHPSNS